MDRIQLASGEREEETSQKNETSNENSVTQEYLLGAIQWLETFTGKTLSEMDAKLWMERLSKYPKWKLAELGEYTGTLSNDVFKYLDGIQQKPVRLPTLPEPDRTPRDKRIAKDFLAHIKKVLDFDGTREERLKWEFEDFRKLGKKYPDLVNMEEVRREKRFQGFE